MICEEFAPFQVWLMTAWVALVGAELGYSPSRAPLGFDAHTLVFLVFLVQLFFAIQLAYVRGRESFDSESSSAPSSAQLIRFLGHPSKSTDGLTSANCSREFCMCRRAHRSKTRTDQMRPNARADQRLDSPRSRSYVISDLKRAVASGWLLFHS
jgi:hypothetical protein